MGGARLELGAMKSGAQKASHKGSQRVARRAELGVRSRACARRVGVGGAVRLLPAPEGRTVVVGEWSF